jgi:hypothetical protein
MNPGIINDIPLVKAKCPRAENNNIADRDILPANANLYLPRVILKVNSNIQNTTSRTSNGFIIWNLVLQKSKDLNNETMNPG